MNSIFRLQLEADKFIIAGVELARSVQTPFEYTSRTFLSIPTLSLKLEDFNLIRLDPRDILITKETNYKLPGILINHCAECPIEKLMFNTNYRVFDDDYDDIEDSSRTHLLKQYFYSSELPEFNHLIELNETLSTRSTRKIDASAKVQGKFFWNGFRGKLTDFKKKLVGEVAIGQVRIDKYRQIERNTNFAAQLVARALPKPKRMLISVHRQRSGRIFLSYNENSMIDTTLNFNQNINANRKQYNVQVKSINLRSLDASLIMTKNWISMPVIIQIPGLHRPEFQHGIHDLQLHTPRFLSNIYSKIFKISPESFITGFKIEFLPKYSPGKLTAPLFVRNSFDKAIKEYHFQAEFTQAHLMNVLPDNRILIMVTEKKRAIFALEVNRFKQPGNVNVYGRLKTGQVLPVYDVEFSGQLHVVRKRSSYTSAAVSYIPKCEVKIKSTPVGFTSIGKKRPKFTPYEVYSEFEKKKC